MANQLEETFLLTDCVSNSGIQVGNRIKVSQELMLICRVALPGIISRVTTFGLIVVTQMFVGHVSSVVLAAFSLCQTVIVRFVYAVMIGMWTATETLCGQAFGAGQYHMMGIYLQRSWIVNIFTVTLLAPFFIFSKQIFLSIGQTKFVAETSGVLSPWLLGVAFSYTLILSSQMFLQSQMKNKIVGWLSVPGFFLHIVFSLLVVTNLDLGIIGEMASYLTMNWMTAIICIVYILGGWCPETWRGFNKASVSDLWPVIKLSATSALMLCLEMWYTCIIILLAGYMPDPETQISAFSICVRVSNELGRGDAKAAQFAMKVIFSISITLGIISFIICIAFAAEIASFFSSDDSVKESVATLSVPLALSVLLNSIQSVLNGIAIGSGLQTTVAVVNLGTYYAVGLPVGACLGYLTQLKIKGLWYGFLSGVVLQVLFLVILVRMRDWEEQVNKASGRLGRWYVTHKETHRVVLSLDMVTAFP